MNITMKKADIIARLESALKVAKKADYDASQKLLVDQQKALKEFHSRCRDALKWDYVKAAKSYGPKSIYRPQLPSSASPGIEKLLKQIKLDSRTKDYPIKEGTELYNAIIR